MQRWRFRRELEKLNGQPVFYLDECGVDHRLYRESGRAPRGQRIYETVAGKRWERTSIISASQHGNPFALRADWADEMFELVKKEKKENAQSAELVAAQKRAEIEKISQRLQRLLDSLLDGLIERETFTTEKAKLMSRKKTLEEQIKALSGNPKVWLEPFQNWILTARNAGEIAISGSLQEKRVLAQQVFGSNLVLDCKKARGSCVKPWSLLIEPSPCGGMVGTAGFEPATFSV